MGSLNSTKLVAIAPFLRSCPKVITLGMRAALGDYSPRERGIMLSAPLVVFPTPRFVGIFETAGKRTFPSPFVYRVRKSRVVQEVLFQFLRCPHPRTRIYFGRKKQYAAKDFSYPFLAMGPDVAHGGLKVTCPRELEALAARYNPLIVQEMVEYEERFRLTFVNYGCVGIQKRRIPSGHSLEQTGRVKDPQRGERGEAGSMPDRFEPVDAAGFSRDILCDLQRLLGSVRLDDTAVEIGLTARGWQVVALSRPPLSWQAPQGIINRHDLISRLIESEEL